MDFIALFLDKLNADPLYERIGIRVKEAANGRSHSKIEPDSKFCWPFPDQPQIHNAEDRLLATGYLLDIQKRACDAIVTLSMVQLRVRAIYERRTFRNTACMRC